MTAVASFVLFHESQKATWPEWFAERSMHLPRSGRSSEPDTFRRTDSARANLASAPSDPMRFPSATVPCGGPVRVLVVSRRCRDTRTGQTPGQGSPRLWVRERAGRCDGLIMDIGSWSSDKTPAGEVRERP